MASSGITGTGTTLSGSVTLAGGFSDVTSISGPGATTTDIDITNMDSVAKEFVSGLPDWGEVTIGLLYGGTDAQVLDGRIGQAAETWTLTFSNTDTFTFSGYIKGLGLEVPMDDVVSQEVTIKLTGAPTGFA